MQIQFNDVRGGECALGEVGEAQFVDDARTRDANWALLVASRMRCDDDAAEYPLGSHRDLWAIVEATHHLAFWTLLELIWGQMQTGLDQRMIECGVLFTSCHKSESGQIREHGSGPILAVEPEQSAPLWELVGREIPTNGREAPTQFLPVAPVASVAKRAEPTFSCGPD